MVITNGGWYQDSREIFVVVIEISPDVLTSSEGMDDLIWFSFPPSFPPPPSQTPTGFGVQEERIKLSDPGDLTNPGVFQGPVLLPLLHPPVVNLGESNQCSSRRERQGLNKFHSNVPCISIELYRQRVNKFGNSQDNS